MAKKIMIQGTMSGSGKSFVVAGLCRYFKNKGYKVAPFKSQNMALNSYVTADGLEIGRAQAMQAEAAKVAPSVWMNPILLKPNSDFGSQVILNGKVYGNVKAMEYFFNKRKFIPKIMDAFETLDREYDIIVIEGAGSPAEINLKKDDIVNMGLAKLVDAPVLLVGDIDRGGVFASLFGTVKLLEIEEQERIKGLIINKFRGDLQILEPGLRQISEVLQKPVIGCIPMRNLDIEDEDSLSERFLGKSRQRNDGMRIGILHFPHISNFTDFIALERVDGISIDYIRQYANLDELDVIILPGTKSTMADLEWLNQNGLASEVKRQAERGKLILGICGGYQMLGKRIVDMHKVESDIEAVPGLHLLDMETVFAPIKTTRLTRARWAECLKDFLENADFMQERMHAYEIHMGTSRNLGNSLPFIESDSGEVIGLMAKEQRVFGTYLHGWFDNRCVLQFLKEKTKKNIDIPTLDYRMYKDREYDKLAVLMEESLDMTFIHKMMGLGAK